MDPATLRDDVVVLTPPHADDVPDITLACQDPAIAAWTTVPSPYSAADATGFVEHWVQGGWAEGTCLTWAVRARAEAPDADPAAGRLLGVVGLDGVADGSAELGYWAAPWSRGRGFTQRAVGLVLAHALDPDGVDLTRVSWSAFVGNWPSRRVAWNAGIRVEGTLRGYGAQRRVRRDSWVGSILRGDPFAPTEPWPAGAPDLQAVERMTP